jgi:hypothetical protein
MLLLRGGAVTLELAEESEMILRGATNGEQGAEAELNKGALAFRAARPGALEIVAREARVRPSTEAQTIAQVSVTGPKELRIYARRGSLQFSYRGETETIAEGESYRVILDPSQDDPKKDPVKPGRRRKGFIFLALAGGAAAGAGAVLLFENHGQKQMVSPDRP